MPRTSCLLAADKTPQGASAAQIPTTWLLHMTLPVPGICECPCLQQHALPSHQSAMYQHNRLAACWPIHIIRLLWVPGNVL